jgi:hypothetical protein
MFPSNCFNTCVMFCYLVPSRNSKAYSAFTYKRWDIRSREKDESYWEILDEGDIES